MRRIRHAHARVPYAHAPTNTLRTRYSNADRTRHLLMQPVLAHAHAPMCVHQVRWFRSEPRFEWVGVDFMRPETTVAHVLSKVALSRDEFRRQERTAARPAIEKQTLAYAPHLRRDDGELVVRADACRLRLEPKLLELLAADAAVAQHLPWHKRPGWRQPARRPTSSRQ